MLGNFFHLLIICINAVIITGLCRSINEQTIRFRDKYSYSLAATITFKKERGRFLVTDGTIIDTLMPFTSMMSFYLPNAKLQDY